MPLHTDFRPKSLDEIVGNRITVQSLSSILQKDSKPHTYLFTGDRGCGKTTMARIAAKELGCEGFNLKEINCSDNRKIEDAREIIRKSRTKGLNGGNKAWILDEFHLFGEGGASSKNKPQNALLKILEEPPEHCFFLLCSTDPDMILKTIRSRCSEFEVQKLSARNCKMLLRNICNKLDTNIPTKVLDQVAASSEGLPRDALTILEKVLDLPEKEMLRAAKQAIASEGQAIDLCRALMQRKPWDNIVSILKGIEGEEPEKIRRMMIDYCSKVILNKNPDPQAYVVFDCFREPFYNNGWPGLRFACYEALEAE